MLWLRRLVQKKWKQFFLTASIFAIFLYVTVTVDSERYNPLAKNVKYAWNRWQSDKDVLFSLVREEELDGMISSIEQLQERFNNKFHYDWLFVSETNFTTEFRDKIQSTLTSGQALFEQIPHEFWSYPDYIDSAKAAEGRKKLADDNVMYANSESYRHMCRFNSGFFQHLKTLQNYRYYWRVEPNVRFKCDIPEDPFKIMREGNYVYGWTMTMPEDVRTVRTLWSATKNFIHTQKPYIPLDNMLDFISDDNALSYNMCHYWSNFEIADLDFLRSDVYQAYFDHLDRSGGFFYERWGDAPVHTLAVSLFLPADKIKHFPNVGYYHEPNQGCPRDRKLHEALRCDCDPDEDWTFHQHSCTNKYYQVKNETLPFTG